MIDEQGKNNLSLHFVFYPVILNFEFFVNLLVAFAVKFFTSEVAMIRQRRQRMKSWIFRVDYKIKQHNEKEKEGHKEKNESREKAC
jgi:hypothetical protein